ncbi:MAG TPA: CBS domain-containing protein [Ilumatobacteraceae bacterium]
MFVLVGGRAAWTVQGLPTEGQIGDRRRVSRFVEPVATVRVDSTIADVRALADREPPVVVISDRNVVLGLVEEVASALPGDTPVEALMVPAPGTIRPDVRVDDALRQLRGDGLAYSLVTTARGELLGIVRVSNVHV